MTVEATPDSRELRPAGRYEWEQILRRARLADAIAGKRGATGRLTRGGVSGALFKAVAFTIASYGNGEGQEIRPHDATIAVDLETTLKTVKTVKAKLLQWGLLVRSGTHRGRPVYRLTIPSDLLELVDVLTPAQHKLEAKRISAEAHGRVSQCGGSGGAPTAAGSEPTVGGPVDTPLPVEADAHGGSGGHPAIQDGGSTGHPPEGPVDPPMTNQDRTRYITQPEIEDVRTDLAVVAREAEQEPISDEVQNPPPALTVVSGVGRHRTAQPAARGFWPAAVPEPVPPLHPGVGGKPDADLAERSQRGAAACRESLRVAADRTMAKPTGGETVAS